MSEFKVWVGHMFDDPSAWFVVSAPTRDEALWVADELGQIDTRSLHEVTSPFAIEIGSHIEEDTEDGDVLVLGSKELHDAGAIYWTDDAAIRWSTALWNEPLTGDDDGMIDSAAEGAASQHRIRVKDSRRPRRRND